MIFDEQNRVLLCHRRDHDLWNLPGGALESGEAPWNGVKREVKEETGLEVEITKLAGVYSKPEKNDMVFSFVCKITSGQITLNDEADRIEYFEVEKLPANTLLPVSGRCRMTIPPMTTTTAMIPIITLLFIFLLISL